MPTAVPNRKYKDRLFLRIFREKEDLLSLYNAVNGSHYEDPDALETSIDQAIEDCLQHNIMVDFLTKHREEARFMISNSHKKLVEQPCHLPAVPPVFYFLIFLRPQQLLHFQKRITPCPELFSHLRIRLHQIHHHDRKESPGNGRIDSVEAVLQHHAFFRFASGQLCCHMKNLRIRF